MSEECINSIVAMMAHGHWPAQLKILLEVTPFPHVTIYLVYQAFTPPAMGIL